MLLRRQNFSFTRACFLWPPRDEGLGRQGRTRHRGLCGAHATARGGAWGGARDPRQMFRSGSSRAGAPWLGGAQRAEPTPEPGARVSLHTTALRPACPSLGSVSSAVREQVGLDLPGKVQTVRNGSWWEGEHQDRAPGGSRPSVPLAGPWCPCPFCASWGDSGFARASLRSHGPVPFSQG